MNEEPVQFIGKVSMVSIVLTVILEILFFLLFSAFRINLLFLILLLPLFLVLSFMYLVHFPNVKIRQRMGEVDRELVFAGRHMLIELRAGIPLFDAMASVTKDYGEASKEFAKIVEKITTGVPADVAMHEIAELNPSNSFKRVILQIINSIRSGSDVANGLEAVLDQVSREQVIELKAYAQKLNPLAMFYMLFGIIFPSLGVALMIIILSFFGVAAPGTLLIGILSLLTIMQYLFMTMIETSRPKYYI
ncbi:type II secretion system F family protein [Candidatus Micrarchaeota archaeon]|nr:type II secretion system F family protein [Candidatus Micrarchaeota archaeon]